MLKQTFIGVIALAAMSAVAQDNMMMTIDAKGAKPYELKKFIVKDAYRKLGAGYAYTLTTFVDELPGNYQTAILRGLAMNAEEAQTMKEQNQTAANAMAPMGDAPMMTMMPMKNVSYWTAIETLQKDQDATDQGLIASLFQPKLFTMDPLMSPCNEKALDAIVMYIKANASYAEPIRLKYTSLAPHTYAGLPANWSSLPWPAGS